MYYRDTDRVTVTLYTKLTAQHTGTRSFNDRKSIIYLQVKVKQSRYRPGVAQRVPGN
jgi:hypothetical protein